MPKRFPNHDDFSTQTREGEWVYTMASQIPCGAKFHGVGKSFISERRARTDAVSDLEEKVSDHARKHGCSY